jgi:glycosyltransferase involved in cell wall biosynthesis
MKKILFIDVPFADASDRDNQRSSFIWEVLSHNFDADLLLVKTRDYLTKNTPEHKGYEQLFTLAVSNPAPFHPQAIYSFSQENLDKFSQILVSKRYEYIFVRRLRCARLIQTAEKTLPDCRIQLDIDALPSETALAAWRLNPTWKNKKAQFDYMTLRSLEKSLFSKNHHFSFTGKALMRKAMNTAGMREDSPNFSSLPNPLPKTKPASLQDVTDDGQKALLADKFILFYGNLCSEENLDAFLYLAKDIYPRISRKLQEKDIKLYIAGDNPQKLHETFSGGRIKLIGPVDNLQAFIKASLFVVLPLRQSTADTNRILEAALLQKAVLTTSKTVADLDLSAEDIGIEDKVEGFCELLTRMLQKTGETIDMGKLLHDKITGLYDKESIEKQLLQQLENLPLESASGKAASGLKIAIFSNNFWPETDKISCHVLNMAKKLAETNDVTVFCPRRMFAPKHETIDNINVIRLFDIHNYSAKGSNAGSKTLCPELFFRILKQDFNIVQFYPGFDSNYVMAFLAAKIKEVPIVLNLIDFQDYEQIVKESGTATQDIIRNIELGWLEKTILKNTDFLFTVTEKEYSFFRKLHEQVEHIPLPVLFGEESADLPQVLEKTGFPEDAFIFLCVGKIEFLKGQDLLLKAFIKALPALPKAKLVFIGKTDSEPDFYEDLEAIVSREALHEEVLFTGEVGREEALAWLQASDIHVIPARFMHIGNVVVDSWATGTPVLQSDAVDPNLVIDGFNGYLFRTEDVEDLAQQIQRAYNNKAGLAELGEHGKALVDDKYSFDYLLKRYLHTYKQLTL